jgi:hypothetical protein
MNGSYQRSLALYLNYEAPGLAESRGLFVINLCRKHIYLDIVLVLGVELLAGRLLYSL